MNRLRRRIDLPAALRAEEGRISLNSFRTSKQATLIPRTIRTSAANLLTSPALSKNKSVAASLIGRELYAFSSQLAISPLIVPISSSTKYLYSSRGT